MKNAEQIRFSSPGWVHRRGRAWLLALALFFTVLQAAADFEERLVAAVLMAEARGDGVLGMTAVGEVIANRARLRQMRPAMVVREAWQFSPLNQTRAHELISRFEKMPLYRDALQIAKTVIQTPSELPGLTAGADHFAQNLAPVPQWARGRRPVAIVGRHRFWLLRN